MSIHVIASDLSAEALAKAEAKQSSFLLAERWIASSLSLLAMTAVRLFEICIGKLGVVPTQAGTYNHRRLL
jgi:hypothetical protein